ncbi:MAG: FmdB family transcriptional regulator [Actinomycetia bacterium]|nr:FmdB family transcriptional regulator [Actinomycetes bacterium]
MPAYDYKCPSCDCVFEVNRGIQQTGPIACPTCGIEAKRVFAPVGIVFKGSGFHNTDYRPKQAVPAASEGASDTQSAQTAACAAEGSPACASCPAAE